ncbi:hypothetical protein MCSF7_02081 [Mycoplasmopsis columbina SF7]|uniref:FAD synthase n=1 Tax=Mycoplasmopsis columbina SF7 TaxID=1037410 RepID=F9UKK3_9BACT|nr:hypothetical protein [Mycoplasmopsis columbina]EGV00208.1 hypothetical protein MCSF7_02081 [Mycoplasmopsis columbina SF7]
MSLTIYTLDNQPKFNNPIYILGAFESFHLGHWKLLEKAYELNNNKDSDIVLVFFQDCQNLPKNQDQILTDLNFRLQSFANLNLKYALSLNYNEIKSFTHEYFINSLVAKQSNFKFVIGEDFKFGFKAQGSAKWLAKVYGDNLVFPVEPIKKDQKKISTSFLKECVENGEIELLNSLNTFKYGFSINLKNTKMNENNNLVILKNPILTPLKEGIYIVNIEIDQFTYYGLINYGFSDFFELMFFDVKLRSDLVFNEVNSKIRVILLKNLRFFIDKSDSINKADLIHGKNFFIEMNKNS